MARKQPAWAKHKPKVKSSLKSKTYINGLAISPRKLPEPHNVRNYLENVFKICSNRQFRLILVEDFKDYKIFIQVPDGKSECDFYVWYAKFDDSENPVECRVPTHDYLANWYSELKMSSETIEEYLKNAVIRLIRDRKSVEEIIEKYFAKVDKNIELEISKFLSTLKWVALQEDTNYPPPRNLGSKLTLAVYALLEFGFDLRDIRKVIRF